MQKGRGLRPRGDFGTTGKNVSTRGEKNAEFVHGCTCVLPMPDNRKSYYRGDDKNVELQVRTPLMAHAEGQQASQSNGCMASLAKLVRWARFCAQQTPPTWFVLGLPGAKLGWGPRGYRENGGRKRPERAHSTAQAHTATRAQRDRCSVQHAARLTALPPHAAAAARRRPATPHGPHPTRACHSSGGGRSRRRPQRLKRAGYLLPVQHAALDILLLLRAGRLLRPCRVGETNAFVLLLRDGHSHRLLQPLEALGQRGGVGAAQVAAAKVSREANQVPAARRDAGGRACETVGGRTGGWVGGGWVDGWLASWQVGWVEANPE